VLLCMLEAVEGRFCLLEVMRCVLLVILGGCRGRALLPEMFEVLEVVEVICSVLFCMLEVVESQLCLSGGDPHCAALYGSCKGLVQFQYFEISTVAVSSYRQSLT